MLSACIIHRDDPHIAETVASIRPWVQEICIVSEIDNTVARALADRFEVCTDYIGPDDGPEVLRGRLNHFGAMRQRALELATQPYALWIDSDDVLVGGAFLTNIVSGLKNHGPNPRLLCKYEYATDAKGRAHAVQWRERIVPTDGSFHWEHRGHEQLVSTTGIQTDCWTHDLIWVHKRTAPKEIGKNLALIRLEAAETGHNGWTRYNLGVECFFAAGTARTVDEREDYFREAIEHLTARWEIEGGDDERALTALKLSESYLGLDFYDGAHQEALEWAGKAAVLRPTWVEPQLALARLCVLTACQSKVEDEQRLLMRHAVTYCDNAIAGKTETPLVVRPLEQAVNVYAVKQGAHEMLEEWPEALACVQKLIAEDGYDAVRLLCERKYREKLGESFVGPNGLDIVIAAPGYSSDRWDPDVLRDRGCGGSETAVIEMSKRLVAMGHRVRVFGNPSIPGMYDGVEYHPFQLSGDMACDVLVAWRLAPMLEWCDAKVRMLWVHDTIAHRMTSAFALKADAILALSEWHRQNLVRVHKVHPDHVCVTQNGIDLARFSESVPRNPHRAIYSSSPDRGLAVLLDLWPRIRAQVPDAELAIFYGLDNWRAGLDRQPDMQHRYVIAHIEERCRALKTEGVTYYGQVDQATLAKHMLGAGVWCSPHWFDETSCIGAMEAQAAGLRIVTSSIAALKETVADRGMLLDGDWLTEDYQNRFVTNVIEAMSWHHWGPYSRQEVRKQAQALFSWDRVAQEWDAMMRELLDRALYGSLPPYYGVAA